MLAGDLGPEQRDRRRSADAAADGAAPVLIAAEQPVTDWLKPVSERPGCFRTDGVGHEQDVDLVPFYRLHRRRYAIYWDLFTPPEWEQRAAEIAAQQLQQRELEAATVGYVQPGEMQAERDANLQGENTTPARVMGRPGRRGSDWFSFDLPVDPEHPMALVITYNRDEWQDRTFQILVDDRCVGEQTIERRGPLRFFDVQYALPAEAVQGKQRVTVKFQATQGNEIGAVFGIRMIRADAQQGETASLAQHVGHVSALWPNVRAYGSRRADRFAGEMPDRTQQDH